MKSHGITYHHHATGKTAYICAWCDRSKSITSMLQNQGYSVSHGICEQHKRDMIQDVARMKAANQLVDLSLTKH